MTYNKDLIHEVSTWSISNGWFVWISVGIYLAVFGILLPKLRIRVRDPLWPVGTMELLYILITVLSHGTLFLLNGLLSYALLKNILRLKYNWICQPIQGTSLQEIRIANLLFIFLLIKYLEWSDTVLLVRQMGRLQHGWYLHVIHHGGMVLLAWITIKTYPAGTTSIMVLMNSVTHTCDYGVHVVRKLGFDLDVNRIHINRIRRVQFLSVAGGCFLATLIGCGVPRLLLLGVGTFSFFLLVANIQFTGRCL